MTLFLQHSKDPLQQSIWSKIDKTEQSNDSQLQFSKISEGISALSEIKHLGFVVESSYAEFLTSQHCDLSFVGHFGNRHYAIAFPKNSLYKESISIQVTIFINANP